MSMLNNRPGNIAAHPLADGGRLVLTFANGQHVVDPAGGAQLWVREKLIPSMAGRPREGRVVSMDVEAGPAYDRVYLCRVAMVGPGGGQFTAAAKDLEVIPPPSAVVSLVERLGYPSLKDIPNQMRRLADEIERGDVLADGVLCLVVSGGERGPAMYAWGETGDRYREAGILQAAVAQHLARE